VEYEDLLTIATPEGVSIDLTLAGYGSRFIASMVDGVLKFVVVGAAALVLAVVGGGVGAAVFLVLLFVVTVVYDVAFETLANGRTPGKRWSGLRVVKDDGRPVTFTISAVRNVLRIIDGPGTAYAAGTIAILATKHNQRLGDLAAGTLVVRERGAAAPSASRPRTEPGEADQWDVTGIGADELAMVRQFLGRRHEIDGSARNALARRLADGLRPRVPGAPERMSPERFLEQLAAAKSRRG
jgi:uncharacterized RDD family membrane protein YckC